jgi:hypothetical protein
MILLLAFAAGTCLSATAQAQPAADSATTPPLDRNVIVITSDGYRWQELFRGANPAMYSEINKVTTPSLLQKEYGTSETKNRREKLMPFIWGKVAAMGQLYGNRDKGSIARVSNDKWFSYPGYNELLTGYPDNTIASNRKIPNKNHTVFEWLNSQPELQGKVAAFGAWDAFPAIFNITRAGIKVDAGHGDPYESFKDYLKTEKPRAMFLGFGETDHQGHAGNYSKYLDAAHHVDACMADLWETLQSIPQYRDKTTIIFTADHGRGNSKNSPKAWNSHGRSMPDSDSLFVVVWGPDTPPKGEIHDGPEILQAQVAATAAKALGYDYPAAQPKAAPPIPGAIVRK